MASDYGDWTTLAITFERTFYVDIRNGESSLQVKVRGWNGKSETDKTSLCALQAGKAR